MESLPIAMRIPIAIKYSLLFLTAILLTSALLSWNFLDYMKVEMESELLKRGQSISRNLAYSVAPLLLSKDEAKISASLKNVLKEPDVETASVLDHQHTIVADSWPRRIGRPFDDPLFDPGSTKDSERFESEADDQIVFFQVATFGGVKVGSVVVRISRSVLHLAIESATRRVLYITGIIAGFVILLSFITLSRTIKPLAKVLEGTKRISRGDFSTRLKVKSKDEIGELATAFNDMAARTELFFRYVDKSIAERLVNDESLARPGGQLKQVSVLFGDMRDFTELSNQRSPSEVVWILNTYFDLFFQVVHHFGGVVDKTMGDAIMAFFEPSHSSDIDNSRSATMAAVSMKAACWILEFVVQEAASKKIAVSIETRKFGFAVATGRLIVGNIGSSRRMDYTVCGPAVNLASRLQMDTKQGQILLDKFTAMDVEDIVDLRELEQVRPKGFSAAQAVTPYQVIRVKPAEMVKIRSLLRRLFDKRFLHEHLLTETGESRLSKEQLDYLVVHADRRISSDPPAFLVT
jgi:adenylate cyclase